jgi:hypothetical protein
MQSRYDHAVRFIDGGIRGCILWENQVVAMTKIFAGPSAKRQAASTAAALRTRYQSYFEQTGNRFEVAEAGRYAAGAAPPLPTG